MTQHRALIVISIATVVLLLAAAAGCWPALFAPMMFDSPGSEGNPATRLLFYSVTAFPVTCIVAITSSWVLYARQKFTGACMVTLLPLVNLVLLAIAWIWLSVSYGGRFGG